MPPVTPTMPLGLLNPGEFIMGGPGGLSAGANTNFAGAMSNAMSGALAVAGYGTIASGLTAVTGGITGATAIITQFAEFGTVPSGAGAQLPAPSAVPYPVYVANFGVSGLSVFPPNISGSIGTAASGVASLQATGTVVPYYFAGGNQYYHG